MSRYTLRCLPRRGSLRAWTTLAACLLFMYLGFVGLLSSRPLSAHWLSSKYSAPARANATFVILTRNWEAYRTAASIRENEERFNKRYNYPYVLLNDEPFNEQFKEQVLNLTRAKVEFGVIPKEHWEQPNWINENKAEASRKAMVEKGVVYADSISYRNMCRFYSGFFFQHPLLQKYRWYWRIEPNVHFYCDLDFDPFVFMEQNKKTYGFTISLLEFPETIKSLWQTVREFSALHPNYLPQNNTLSFLSDDEGASYNLCHFWSNFEIADMDFWRGEVYQAFFNFLDQKGGFYYERWGDAPIHTIAASLFLPRDQIHFFDEIGYEHAPYLHCPTKGNNWDRGKCRCDARESFDYAEDSCLRRWEAAANGRPYTPPPPRDAIENRQGKV